MIRLPGTVERLPPASFVRLYGLCTSIDMEACQLTLSLNDKATVVDYSLVAPKVDVCTGIYYCFFGTMAGGGVVRASTGRPLTHNVQWGLVERFIDITDGHVAVAVGEKRGGVETWRRGDVETWRECK